MSHTSVEKKKLIDRVRRIKGQVEAIESALENEKECSEVLHQIAGCRGAMNGLMSQVVEGHIRSHIMDPEHCDRDEQIKAAEDLITLFNSYLK